MQCAATGMNANFNEGPGTGALDLKQSASTTLNS